MAIKAIGSFDNVWSDGEHASGYAVHLWSHGQEILGFVAYHVGLAGDPPIGVLQDVQFNPSTRALAFRAKLTIGLHSCRVHEAVPTRTLLSFNGQLSGTRLQGHFTLLEQLDTPPLRTEPENALLRKDLEASSMMNDYDTIDAWWQHVDRILKRRGPKW